MSPRSRFLRIVFPSNFCRRRLWKWGLQILRFLCLEPLFFCVQRSLIGCKLVFLILQFQLLFLIVKLANFVVQGLDLSGVVWLLVTGDEGKHPCEAGKREKSSSHI